MFFDMNILYTCKYVCIFSMYTGKQETNLLKREQSSFLCFELHSSWLEISSAIVMSQETLYSPFPFNLVWAVLADLYFLDILVTQKRALYSVI